MSRARLFLVVALSGAAVLTLEILGTRVLGPFYGVSLFLWSALISVTLAALAAGYALGGRWAQRSLSTTRLSWLLAAAGAWVLLVPWTRGPLIAVASHLGLRGAVLLAATLLFFPPLMLLGMVSPYAIRLGTRSVDEVGRVSGDLFAVSTLASVGAALSPDSSWSHPSASRGCCLPSACCCSSLRRSPGSEPAAPSPGSRSSSAAPWPCPAWAASSAYRARCWREPRAPTRSCAWSSTAACASFMIDGGIHSMINAETEAPHQPYVYIAELALDAFPAPDARSCWDSAAAMGGRGHPAGVDGRRRRDRPQGPAARGGLFLPEADPRARGHRRCATLPAHGRRPIRGDPLRCLRQQLHPLPPGHARVLSPRPRPGSRPAG